MGFGALDSEVRVQFWAKGSDFGVYALRLRVKELRFRVGFRV